jgi:hypothetical protein
MGDMKPQTAKTLREALKIALAAQGIRVEE